MCDRFVFSMNLTEMRFCAFVDANIGTQSKTPIAQALLYYRQEFEFPQGISRNSLFARFLQEKRIFGKPLPLSVPEKTAL